MNVVYSSSDEYCRHLGVSLTSLYEENKMIQDVSVFIIDFSISERNKERLDAIAEEYGRNITYFPFEQYAKLIVTDGSYSISLNSYARLLIADILPLTINRVVWLDCDTVVTAALSDLWNMDMEGKAIAAVLDCGGFWEEIHVEGFYDYFCAGVFLADLSKWRDMNFSKLAIDYIETQNGHLEHVDQTVLNGVLYNDVKVIHPRYDVLTPTFVMPYNNLVQYFKLENRYYSRQEIKDSIDNPAIIHFTSSNSGRPWEKGCRHPLKNVYRKYWKESAWMDEPGGCFVQRWILPSGGRIGCTVTCHYGLFDCTRKSEGYFDSRLTQEMFYAR